MHHYPLTSRSFTALGRSSDVDSIPCSSQPSPAKPSDSTSACTADGAMGLTIETAVVLSRARGHVAVPTNRARIPAARSRTRIRTRPRRDVTDTLNIAVPEKVYRNESPVMVW
jgi:hypothetical protein